MRLEMKAKSLMCFEVIAFAIPALALKQDPEYRQARHEGAEAKFELRVVDDDDVLVEGATVKVFMGMNYREKGYWLNGETNTNGTWVLQGKTCGNEIEIGIKKDGYYDSNRKMCLATMGAEHEVKDGKWQPWGKEERIVLRKIKNQKSMVKCSDVFIMPTTNKWVGFDFELKDWVAPYGRGRTSDVEAYLTWDGKPPTASKFVRLDVRFSDVCSGCYFADKIIESKFTGVYNAVTNDCYETKSLVFHSDKRDGRHDVKEFDYSKVLVVRTRCKLDDAGNVVSANYSTIRAILVNGGWDGRGEMTLRYYYNPTPNDTNLEPKR